MSVENFTAVVNIGSFEKSKVSKSIDDEIGLVLSLKSVYIICDILSIFLFIFR